MMVVIHHAQSEAAVLAGRAGVAGAYPWQGAGLPWPAGVDIFFVVSGFVIVHAARGLYGVPGGARRFLAHRVARLVPLYWLVSAVYLAIALAVPGVLSGDGMRPGPGYVVASFLFWPAVRPDGAAVPLYGLGWTLQYEMLFYALFAVGLGWGRRFAVAWIAGTLGLLLAASVAIPSLPMPLAFWANPIVLEFAFGAGLSLARAEGLRLSRALRLGLAILGLGLLASAGPPDATTRPWLWGVPALCLVAAAVLGADRRAREGRLVRAAERLGAASYALYLVHPFALRLVREVIVRGGLAPAAATPAGTGAGLALMIGAAVLAALAVEGYVERPLTRWARRRLDPGASAGDGAVLRLPAGREGR